MKFNLKPITILLFFTITILSCKNKKQEKMNKDEHKLNAIFPKGEKGAIENFTGNAYHVGLVNDDSTFTTVVGNVYFEPGARSNWHSHPAGQILIITDGIGYHQIEGKPIEIIQKGSIVKCPPNVRHWHGASPNEGLMQLYIVPNTEKGIVNWDEAVTDAVYKTAKSQQ